MIVIVIVVATVRDDVTMPSMYANTRLDVSDITYSWDFSLCTRFSMINDCIKNGS